MTDNRHATDITDNTDKGTFVGTVGTVGLSVMSVVSVLQHTLLEKPLLKPRACRPAGLGGLRRGFSSTRRTA